MYQPGRYYGNLELTLCLAGEGRRTGCCCGVPATSRERWGQIAVGLFCAGGVQRAQVGVPSQCLGAGASAWRCAGAVTTVCGRGMRDVRGVGSATSLAPAPSAPSSELRQGTVLSRFWVSGSIRVRQEADRQAGC